MSAYHVGERLAIRNVKNYERPEEIIFDAMKTNPYKGEKAQKDYINGVSAWVNTSARLQNRRMNG